MRAGFCFKMEKSIELPGIGRVEVRRTRNMRRLSIRTAPDKGVWVNVPYGVSFREAERFVAEQREWIAGAMRRMKKIEEETGAGLGMGAEVRTKFHALRVVATDEEKPRYELAGREVTLHIPRRTPYERVAPYVKRFLVEIYRLESKRYLPGRVRELALLHGFRYGILSFRDNVSNWGSCSAEDNISLNIKLMKLPDELIDYVILHELCHTVEKNHSPRFWALLEKVCPGCQAARSRLREYNTRV